MNGSRLYGRSPNTDDQSNNSEPVSKVKNVMGFRRRQTKNRDIQDAKRIEMEARTSSDAVSNDARTRLENGNNGMVAMELEAEQPQMSFVMSLVLITIVVTVSVRLYLTREPPLMLFLRFSLPCPAHDLHCRILRQ